MKKEKNNINEKILKELKKTNKELHDLRIIFLYWGFYGGLDNMQDVLDEHKVNVPKEFSLETWEKEQEKVQEYIEEYRNKPWLQKIKEKYTASSIYPIKK